MFLHLFIKNNNSLLKGTERQNKDFIIMDTEMIKTELKAKLQKGSFVFKEQGNTIPKAQIVKINLFTLTFMNHDYDEHDNYSFEGHGDIKKAVEDGEAWLMLPNKNFNGSAKVVEGEDGKLVIEITKPIIIR